MRIAAAALLLSILPTLGTAQNGESGTGKEEFTAVALSTGGPRTDPVAAQLDIVIERWSTAADQQRLFGSLAKDQDTMLETLRDLPRAGFIRSGGSLGWSLHYAHQVRDADGGRRIFLATDRPISLWEAMNQPFSVQYPFTFIELRLNRHGEGEGKLSRAARIVASDKGFVHLENWENQPVDLTEVKRRD